MQREYYTASEGLRFCHFAVSCTVLRRNVFFLHWRNGNGSGIVVTAINQSLSASNLYAFNQTSFNYFIIGAASEKCVRTNGILVNSRRRRPNTSSCRLIRPEVDAGKLLEHVTSWPVFFTVRRIGQSLAWAVSCAWQLATVHQTNLIHQDVNIEQVFSVRCCC